MGAGARVHERSLWAALGLAVMLAGCSASSVIDKLPANPGLPAGTPERPQASYEYPAVHDMPPDRAAATMTEEEQMKLESDLANARDHQEGRPPAPKKGAAATKKRPQDDENGQPDGAKANP